MMNDHMQPLDSFQQLAEACNEYSYVKKQLECLNNILESYSFDDLWITVAANHKELAGVQEVVIKGKTTEYCLRGIITGVEEKAARLKRRMFQLMSDVNMLIVTKDTV